MFKGILKKRENKPTKEQTWKKFELFELFDDLEQAENILTKFCRNNSGNFILIKEFNKEFVEELYDIKYQNIPDFKQICIWFETDSTWDSIIGKNGQELGNRIFKRANKWNKVNC